MNSFRGIIVFALLLSSCVSTKTTIGDHSIKGLKPVYEDYFDGYLLGWAGEDDQINLNEVCLDQKPFGFQKTYSFQDGFFALISLGIYTPYTVRVWCGE